MVCVCGVLPTMRQQQQQSDRMRTLHDLITMDKTAIWKMFQKVKGTTANSARLHAVQPRPGGTTGCLWHRLADLFLLL